MWWESNLLASESQFWKLTTTLRQQVQRNQNIFNDYFQNEYTKDDRLV